VKSSAVTKNIDIVLAPALYPFQKKSGTVVLIDVLRFTSTMTTALANGALCAETFADPETALKEKSKDYDYKFVGEQSGNFIEGFHFNNSPVAMTNENVGGRKLAFVTTNGTYMRSHIEHYERIYAGCFLNGKALTNRLLDEYDDVQLVCSGFHNKPSIEDTLFAGMVADKLLKSGKYTYNDDIVPMCRMLYKVAKVDIKKFVLKHSRTLWRIYNENPNYHADLDYAFRYNIYDVVPEEEEPYKFVVNHYV